MKDYNDTKIIGIDHGYGNIKTANSCFATGVLASEKEPIFKENMLVWNNRYYLIGERHKEFSADKMLDEDYYVLTLAAIAEIATTLNGVNLVCDIGNGTMNLLYIRNGRPQSAAMSLITGIKAFVQAKLRRKKHIR